MTESIQVAQPPKTKTAEPDSYRVMVDFVLGQRMKRILNLKYWTLKPLRNRPGRGKPKRHYKKRRNAYQMERGEMFEQELINDI